MIDCVSRIPVEAQLDMKIEFFIKTLRKRIEKYSRRSESTSLLYGMGPERKGNTKNPVESLGEQYGCRGGVGKNAKFMKNVTGQVT